MSELNAKRQEIADLMQQAASRYDYLLQNPLESRFYSDDELAGIERHQQRARYWQAMFEVPAIGPYPAARSNVAALCQRQRNARRHLRTRSGFKERECQ